MLDKLKEAAITKGMKLISDPRVMKLMSDPKVMTLLTKSLEFQAKMTDTVAGASRNLAGIFQLASKQEYEEVKEELLAMRERLESLERDHH